MDGQDLQAKGAAPILSWVSASFVWATPGRSLLSQRALPSGAALDASEFGSLDFLRPPWCRICAFPFELDEGSDAICAACASAPPVFSHVRSALVYSDTSSELVLRLKRQGHRNGLSLYARWMYAAGKEMFDTADVLIPIPLHYRRLVTRGFNQAGWLASAVSKVGRIPVRHDMVIRKKASPSQGRLSARQRKTNVSGAFQVSEKAKKYLPGKRVVIIDDVFTTGATVEACAKVLISAGVRNVDVVTLARVVAPKKPLI